MEKNTPGYQLLDKYLDRIMFDIFYPKEKNTLLKQQNILNTICFVEGGSGRLPSHYSIHRFNGCSQTSSQPISPLWTGTLSCNVQGPHSVVCLIRGSQDRIHCYLLQIRVRPSTCGSLSCTVSLLFQWKQDLLHCWIVCKNTSPILLLTLGQLHTF